MFVLALMPNTLNNIISLTTQLITYKSTADRKDEIKKCLAEIELILSKLSVTAQKIESNGHTSILAYKGQKEPEVILHGHIDVVPENEEEQYTAKIEGDKLIGRGGLDMKSGVAIMIELLKNHPSQNFGILITPDEESGGFDGTGYIYNNNLLKNTKCFITLEGDPKLILVHQEKGIILCKITTTGRSAHGSKPWKGESAVEKLLTCLSQIKPLFPNTPEAWSDTITISQIKGDGPAINAVPDKAEATLDIRFTGDEEELTQKLQDICSQNDCQLSITIRGSKVDTPLDAPYTAKLVETVKKHKDVSIGFMHGGSDARFSAEKGVESLIFGPKGDGHHGPNEWVSINSINTVYTVLYEWLNALNSSS
jgi:succinyl-diaminopimelate desuccinylase